MNLNNLTKQYINFLPRSKRNIEIIEHYFDLTRALSPDQKSYLKALSEIKKQAFISIEEWAQQQQLMRFYRLKCS